MDNPKPTEKQLCDLIGMLMLTDFDCETDYDLANDKIVILFDSGMLDWWLSTGGKSYTSIFTPGVRQPGVLERGDVEKSNAILKILDKHNYFTTLAKKIEEGTADFIYSDGHIKRVIHYLMTTPEASTLDHKTVLSHLQHY